MNRLKLIAVLCLFLGKMSFAQDREMYFIIGHPFLEIEQQFDASIVKLAKDTLREIFRLSTEKEVLDFIKVYNDLKLITLLKENKDDFTKKTYIQVNIDSFVRDSIIFNQNSTFIESTRIDKNNQAYLCLYLFRREEAEKQLFQGIRFNNLSIEILNPQDYKNSVIIGSPGGAVQGDDYLNVYYYPEDGMIHIPKTAKVEERPIFPFDIPSNLIPEKKELYSIIINNDLYIVLGGIKSEPSKDEIGYTDLIIKNKPKNDTYKYRIKGNQAFLRNFDNWLAGEVVSSNIKVVLDEKGKVKERINFERVSPGIEDRRKNNTQTGAPFDDRALRFKKVYYPGILYLYNIDSKEYIEWNTGQGDSEILLVQDDIVYYRINDEIYKVPIIEGKTLGKVELLIQDDRVPDIHWAFISKQSVFE